MRVLDSRELAWIAGGYDSVDEITVEPPSDNGGDDDYDLPGWGDDGDDDYDNGDSGDAGGGGRVGDIIDDVNKVIALAGPLIETVLNRLGLNEFTPQKINARDAASKFDIDKNVERTTSSGETYWTQKDDNTLWLDLDDDGKPETHVKVLENGSAYMDGDFDGVFDTKIK